MLETVEVGKEYLSPSGLRFKVLHLAKHGQDCSLPMVVYTNLEPTHDRPANEIWTIEESLFLKLFSVADKVKRKLPENATRLATGIYIVRTQAGFKKVLKRVMGDMGEPKDTDNWPKKYPALISVTVGYQGYTYPQVRCIPLSALRKRLIEQGEL